MEGRMNGQMNERTKEQTDCSLERYIDVWNMKEEENYNYHRLYQFEFTMQPELIMVSLLAWTDGRTDGQSGGQMCRRSLDHDKVTAMDVYLMYITELRRIGLQKRVKMKKGEIVAFSA